MVNTNGGNGNPNTIVVGSFVQMLATAAFLPVAVLAGLPIVGSRLVGCIVGSGIEHVTASGTT